MSLFLVSKWGMIFFIPYKAWPLNKAVSLDKDEFNGDGTQVRCEEGKEPNHLIAMFGGGMAILSGETDEHASLFHIRLNKVSDLDWLQMLYFEYSSTVNTLTILQT